MDRIDATCRKCGHTFLTAAQTRTTCPGCKAAVTVRRLAHSRADNEGEEAAEPNPLIWVAGLIGLAVVSIVSRWRSRPDSAAPPNSSEPTTT
jgi:hypothetical protein